MTSTEVPVFEADGLRASAAASAREASIGSAIRLAAEVVVRTSSVIATLLLTQLLGVESFGTFLLALSIGLLVGDICDFGVNGIVVPQVVRSHANLRMLLLVKAALTALVALICIPIVPVAAGRSGLEATWIVFCIFHFVGASWIEMLGTTLRATGGRGVEALVLVTFRLTLLSLIATAPFGRGIDGVSRAYAVAVFPAAILGAVLVRSWSRRGQTRGPMSTPLEIARLAWPLGLNGFLAIAATRIELFVLSFTWTAGTVGLFGGAVKIVESLITLPTAAVAGALPAVAREEPGRPSGAAQRTFGMVVWIAMPAAFGLWLCAPEVLAVLGPGFTEGAPALRLLAPGLVFCFANVALFHVLIARGDTFAAPIATGLRALAALLASLALIPSFGIEGAAMSFSLAEALLLLILRTRCRVHAAIDARRPFIASAVACLPMVLILLIPQQELALRIVLGAALFTAGGAFLLREGGRSGGLS